MSLIPCPGCSLPRTANDADFECPVCGYVTDGEAAPEPVIAADVVALAEPPVAARPRVAPRPERERSGGPLLPWILSGVGLGGTLVCAVGWYLASTALPELPESKRFSDTVVAITERETTPAPRRVPESTEVTPAPPTLVVEPKPPVGVNPPKPKNPWVIEDRPAKPDLEFVVLRIDAPNEDYKLDKVGAKQRIKLVGRANRLYIDGVTAGATVDATEVDTRWINVTGKVDDGATLKLRSDGGLVNFTNHIGGGATVIAENPHGTVTFAKRTAAKVKANPNGIDGGATVAVTGREVAFLSPIHGDGTTVDITLTHRGRMKFVELDDGAKMKYRMAKPTDPALIVNPGTVKGDAECKRVE